MEVSNISIPLIVALFAFAMPLLFQVITHINSKYSSEAISKMFENSLPYKAYWAVSIFSIVSLITFGVLTLVVTGEEVRQILMTVLNWSSLFVALLYSTAILVFLRTCIRFNSPDKLLMLIGKQYEAELRYDDVKLAVKKLARLRDKMQFWQSKGWRMNMPCFASSILMFLVSLLPPPALLPVSFTMNTRGSLIHVCCQR